VAVEVEVVFEVALEVAVAFDVVVDLDLFRIEAAAKNGSQARDKRTALFEVKQGFRIACDPPA
ncbi:hypothetical protein QN362_18925, partial [Actimicrobium sp. CCC2.4]|uniref:hypothetical protein n=1 Tax=Actimicrobium sp. CCC2.4 TaxID=3048606 RepID=UPI002B25307B